MGYHSSPGSRYVGIARSAMILVVPLLWNMLIAPIRSLSVIPFGK